MSRRVTRWHLAAAAIVLASYANAGWGVWDHWKTEWSAQK